MKLLTVESIIKNRQRNEYIKAMKGSSYGWGSGHNGEYDNICCPSDLPFIRLEEQPHKGMCLSKSCQECWEYVLKNRNW